MKLPVVGGMTQAEGNALGAFVTSGASADKLPNLSQGAQGTLLEDGALPPVAALRALCTHEPRAKAAGTLTKWCDHKTKRNETPFRGVPCRAVVAGAVRAGAHRLQLDPRLPHRTRHRGGLGGRAARLLAYPSRPL